MTNNYLDKANRYYQQGELTKALKAYQHALEKAPDSTDILHAIGVITAQLGDPQHALSYIDKALQQQPDDIRLLNSKANILTRQHKLDEAIAIYHQAIKQDPHYAIAYSGLGNCLLQQDKLTTAKKALQKALELKPNFIEAQYNYALLLVKQKQWDEAVKLLESIINKQPHFSAALGQLGELYLQTGDYERALRVLDQRAELEPQHSEAMHSLAQALVLTNHLEAAVNYYEKTLMLDPHHSEANHNLANAYVTLGDTSKALNYYFRQLSVRPLAESYFNIGVLLMYQERNKEAIDYFNQATQLDPQNVNAFLNLGAIYLKLKNYDKAVSSYEHALTLQPDNEEIQYIIDALKNDVTPERAPNAYLRNLFNQYAHYYDEHLTKYLDYQVPQKLAQLLIKETASEHQTWRVVDLGCGTGLSGIAFKPFAQELIGIDISQKMIAAARKKNIYQQLIVGDIAEQLGQFKDIDLIVAADVFAYIGDLNTLYQRSYEALKAHGLLLFSVERASTGTFTLQKNMRYAHSKKYIETLAKKYQFEIMHCDNTILRKQQKQQVEGFLVMLKKQT